MDGLGINVARVVRVYIYGRMDREMLEMLDEWGIPVVVCEVRGSEYTSMTFEDGDANAESLVMEWRAQ
jgi:hypothetical protein